MKKTIKKSISVLLAIMIFLTAGSFSGLAELNFSVKSAAYGLDPSGQCGENVYWTFDDNSGLLTISGTGKMYGYTYYSSNFSGCYEIKTVIIKYGVTSIGD